MFFPQVIVKLIRRPWPGHKLPWSSLLPGFSMFLLNVLGICSFAFLCYMLPSLWQPIILLFSSVDALVAMCEDTTPIIRTQRCPFRPHWKKARRWKRRRLPYGLVVCCLHRPFDRPCRLDGSYFQSPASNRHRRWRRRNLRARTRYRRTSKARKLCQFLTPTTDGHFHLPIEVTMDQITSFCMSNQHDFLQLPKLLKSFTHNTHHNAVEETVQRFHLFKSSLESSVSLPSKPTFENVALVWDTGASYGLTPYRQDFIDYVEVTIPVKDVTKVNQVVGMGTAIFKFKDSDGKTIFLPCIAYHLPSADIRLFSPQTYHQMHGGHSIVDADHVEMILKKKRIMIPIDHKCTNLPMVFNPSVSKKEREHIKFNYKTRLALSGIRELDALGDFHSHPTVDEEFGHYHKLCCPAVVADENENLSGPQKELLLWHWKLGVSMYRIQEMMRETRAKDKNGKDFIMPPVIKPQYASTSCCPVPKCMSCQLARAKQRNPGVVTKKANSDREAVLSWDRYEAGDFVSMDQFVVTVPGRLPSGYGRENDNARFHGGTIFRDAGTGIIWIENQISLGAGETVLSKIRFEEWLWEQAAVEIRHLHGDNGIFTADMFREDCQKKSQAQSFSGVGAKHQNAQAERAIQTIMYMARTFLIHVSLHWSDRGVDDLALWSFAVKHAAWLYNRVPNRVSGLTPMELLTKTKANHKDLLRTHVWGCPVFVLDPKLQDGKKIPKWNRRSRLGQFLGFSDEHSSLVANIRNLTTGYISPQYHVVFDDLFETVGGSGEADEVVDTVCAKLFENSRDWYVEEEHDENGELIYSPPPLDEVWLTEPERRSRREELSRQRERIAQRERTKWVDTGPPSNNDSPPPLAPIESDSDDDSSTGSVSESGGENSGTRQKNWDQLEICDYDDVQLEPEGVPAPPAPNIEKDSRSKQWG